MNSDKENENIEMPKVLLYNEEIPKHKPFLDNEENMDLYICWKEFNIKPSKICIYSEFETDKIWEIFKIYFNILDKSINKKLEIIHDVDGFIYNTKYLIRINNNLYISFLEFENDKEESFCSNLTIYYNQLHLKISDVNNLISLFQSSINHISSVESGNCFTLNISSNKFELINLNIEKNKLNIDKIYSNKIIKNSRKLIRRINNKKRGLNIISGERGCGKTTMLNNILTQIDDKITIIYIPVSIIEHSINSPEFHSFLSTYNCLLVIDDCENYFHKSYQKHNIFTSNILQLLDGIDYLNIHIILSMNIKHDSIDTNLLNSNNFKSILKFKHIKASKATKLSKLIGYSNIYTEDVKLSDVMGNKIPKRYGKYL